MSLKKDLSDEEFEKLGITKKKAYVANLLIQKSGAQSVPDANPPIAVVMAGVPGAGKTEFLDTLADLISDSELESFVRIDLDEIVTIYPGYTPKTDAQFRSQGNSAVAKCVDVAKKGRFNMMIDGTFAGVTDTPVQNIQRLLESGYIVQMYFMHDDILTSWNYTQAREMVTARGIDRDGFLKACSNVIRNVKKATELFKSNERFLIDVVLQKELRDKDYKVVNDRDVIDKLLDTGYDIDKVKNL